MEEIESGIAVRLFLNFHLSENVDFRTLKKGSFVGDIYLDRAIERVLPTPEF
jgi:hypothetical protein